LLPPYSASAFLRRLDPKIDFPQPKSGPAARSIPKQPQFQLRHNSAQIDQNPPRNILPVGSFWKTKPPKLDNTNPPFIPAS